MGRLTLLCAGLWLLAGAAGCGGAGGGAGDAIDAADGILDALEDGAHDGNGGLADPGQEIADEGASEVDADSGEPPEVVADEGGEAADPGGPADAGPDAEPPADTGGDADGADGDGSDAVFGDVDVPVDAAADSAGPVDVAPDAADTTPVCECDDGDPCTEDACVEGTCQHAALAAVSEVFISGFETGEPLPTVSSAAGGGVWAPRATSDAPGGLRALFAGVPGQGAPSVAGPPTDTTAIMTVTVPEGSALAQLRFSARVDAAQGRLELRVNGALLWTLSAVGGPANAAVFAPRVVPLQGLAGKTVPVSWRFVSPGGPPPKPGGAWLDEVRLEASAPAICLGEGCVLDAGCSDGDPCTVDLCGPGGACEHPPVDCDDAEPCTDDYCIEGACAAVPTECDDGDPCTLDACGPAGCTTLGLEVSDSRVDGLDGPSPLAAWSLAQAVGSPTWELFSAPTLPAPLSELEGVVLYVPRDVGIGGPQADATATLTLPVGGAPGRTLAIDVALALADEGLLADRLEVSLGGALVAQLGHSGASTVELALPPQLPSGLPLGLHFVATGTPELVGGAAIGGVRVRDLPAGCGVAACVLDGACDDSDPCTVDRCEAGVCSSEPVVCAPGFPCATTTCDGAMLCQAAALGCDDGDACTVDWCPEAVSGAPVGNDPEACVFEAVVPEVSEVGAPGAGEGAGGLELVTPNGGIGWVGGEWGAGGLKLEAGEAGAGYGPGPVLAVAGWVVEALPAEATARLELVLDVDDADGLGDRLELYWDEELRWASYGDLGAPGEPVVVDVGLGGEAGAAGTMWLAFQADELASAGAGPVVTGWSLLGVVDGACGGEACLLAGGCDDGDPCTLDRCEVVGDCSHKSVVCDDGLACTDEACVEGRCEVTADRCAP